jgi:two-component system nitrogen regulation sensor histidine kinase GlnL
MDIAVREVDRLNALVTSLLDYARPSTEERRVLDLDDEVREVVAVFQGERRAERQDIRVAVETTGAAHVEGAGGQLRQIVWNLLRNAADAMSTGGTITVKIARESITLDGAGVVQSWTRLTFTDTGSGIPRADLDHIFEPFVSGKKSGQGLGLALVQKLVREMHGRITHDREAATSLTHFRLHLPVASELSAVARAQETTSRPLGAAA